MEINQFSDLDKEKMQYQKAKKKAREIRDFYINLSLFSIFIPIIIFINLYFVPEFHWFWFSIIGWGTGVTFHGLSTFGFRPFLKNDWEKRKIQQFIDQEIELEKQKNHLKNQDNRN